MKILAGIKNINKKIMTAYSMYCIFDVLFVCYDYIHWISWWPGILSGPTALLGFKFERSFLIPKELIMIGGIFGSLSSSLKKAWMGGSGLEKTESNCWRIKFAFLTGSLVGISFWSLISGMPTFCCFLLLIYDHSFLLDLSFSKRFLR